MAFTEDEPREDAEREADGIGLLALDLCEPLALEPVEIGLPERGVENHVGEDVQRGLEVVVQRFE